MTGLVHLLDLLGQTIKHLQDQLEQERREKTEILEQLRAQSRDEPSEDPA